MKGFSRNGFPSRGHPDRWRDRIAPGGEEQTIDQESSKRQQCGLATELAKRTGLESVYAWLPEGNMVATRMYQISGSGKDFDECGCKTVMEVPGVCAPYMLQRRFHTKERRAIHNVL